MREDLGGAEHLYLNTRVKTGSDVGFSECLRAPQYKDRHNNKRKSEREREGESFVSVVSNHYSIVARHAQRVAVPREDRDPQEHPNGILVYIRN